jgi:hypothetical protein
VITTDIAGLQDLPETEPAGLEDLAGTGLLPCGFTCWFWTCLRTCHVTDA